MNARVPKLHAVRAARVRGALLAFATTVLAACATQPLPLQGEFAQITPRDAVQRDSTGSLVRWVAPTVAVPCSPVSSDEALPEGWHLWTFSAARDLQPCVGHSLPPDRAVLPTIGAGCRHVSSPLADRY